MGKRISVVGNAETAAGGRQRDSVDERVDELLGRMTLEEKAGLMFHSIIAVGEIGGELGKALQVDSAAVERFILEQNMTHFNLLGSAPSGREFARWHNGIQKVAQRSRLGIPVTISTDPRHTSDDNPLTSVLSGPFSQWPTALGLGALHDPEAVRRFADIARREYLAVGIRTALHPQIDLTTEPRWSRQSACFGEQAELTGRLARAYIEGFQGPDFGARSVSTMAKHFPGGGPQKDGEDPHFPHGKDQVYPGGMCEEHLKPFVEAVDAGVRQMMPYYGRPVGTGYEEVGFGFNKSVVTGLLRERLGFDGIVCTDWGLVTDAVYGDDVHEAKAWGVEHLTERERVLKILDAGVDQFGGERIPELLVELVREGAVSEERIDASARRLLREKFLLGLFDDPFVDEDAAGRIVGNDEFRAAGYAAQCASTTLLANAGPGGAPLLPIADGAAVYVEGLEPELFAGRARVVDDPAEADVAILRLPAPFERRPGIEELFHVGSLDFPDYVVAHVREVAAAVPTVLNVVLDRPAILTPMADSLDAILADYGSSKKAVVDVLLGGAEPQGRLPFDLPRSMEAVLASRSDVPFDTADPMFRFGHGLRYS
ncbi:glycoside hydrolase family 3 protein [Tomitella gaofuii]|uniref:glycoside hydrolase family 3 protein n=1 Tax=Tomitella gaofuii TaxID=2760083 RepID=UPI001C70EEBB|nr:glycoside hydrolase family 3 N-terminal domain-containing protein [Tomitella gaofuii]